jgi:EmrB/QacA subfamily drug resistance transporter
MYVTSSNPPQSRRGFALALLCTAAFMVILDASVVMVALPSIKLDLGFSAAALPWVVSGYAVTFGGLLLLGGRSADLLGRRRMFMVGSGLFAIASLFCGLAPSSGALIAARLVQGVAAAIMAPTALSILVSTFPQGAERNRALGIWGTASGMGATAGWFVGGPITSQFGWPWIFLMNVPLGFGLVALAPILLQESRMRTEQSNQRFDFAGAATITLACFALVYAVVNAAVVGWTDWRTLSLLGLSVALISLFAIVEGRSAEALVPLHVFRSRALVGGSLVIMANGIVAFGMPFMLTQYAQQVLGLTPRGFGIMSAVLPIMAALASFSGQSAVTRFGARWIAGGGSVLMSLACLLLTRVSVDGSYFPDILLPLLIFGAGIGSASVASSIAALGGVSEADSGLAAGLTNAAFQIGGALGVAVLSTVALSQTVGTTPLVALTHGFQWGFSAAALFPVLALVAISFLFGKAGRSVGSRSSWEEVVAVGDGRGLGAARHAELA